MRSVLSVTLSLIFLSLTTHSRPQNAPSPGPTFEVASVKKSPPPGAGGTFISFGTRKGNSWSATNATLRMLLRSAYGTQYQMAGQIIGGPTWIDTDRFDIVATLEGNPPQDDVRAMVRALLADRFKLVTRQETRELPAYALVVARSDARLGPRMRSAGVDCVAIQEARRRGEAPPPEPRKPGGPPPQCTTMSVFGPVSRIMSGGMTTAQLVSSLSQYAGRPVIDRTGLSGHFVVELEFAAEPGVASPLGAPPPGPATTAPIDTPSVFTAVQEQLGLKLDARREPIDVLVIDKAEQPIPD
jgi:uncharacterized protein (TIGR03435 family)